MIRHPGERASATDELVSVCDIGPTLAELAGISWGAGADGVSQAAVLGGPPQHSPRQWVTAETMLRDGEPGGHGEPFRVSDWTPGRDSLNLSVRTSMARYIYRSHDEDELYLLDADPHEQVNRAADPACQSVRQECRAVLAAEVRDCFPAVARELVPAATSEEPVGRRL
jgi:arylsulfatase A-like enzyme